VQRVDVMGADETAGKGLDVPKPPLAAALPELAPVEASAVARAPQARSGTPGDRAASAF
jgi:hypothetical protein